MTLDPARLLSSTPPTPEHLHRRGGPLVWLATSALLFFLVPWIGADTLGLQPDLYYLGYFTIAVLFFAAFAVHYRHELSALWRSRLLTSLLVGAAVGAVVLVPIFRAAATPHPGGWEFSLAIAWRGAVYGAVDALTLFVLPAAVAYLLMRGNRQGLARKAGFAGLALALSMLVTATYHLGYSEYRDDTMRYPQLGAVVANVPTALTGNPAGAVATHVVMHVGAVVHQYEGGEAHMLPPKVTDDYPNHGSNDLGAGLAAGWLIAAAAASAALVRRQRCH